MQREPVSAARLGREPARRGGELLVGRPLALRAVHPDRHGVTARQLQATTARVLRTMASRIKPRRRSGLAGWRGLPGVI